MLTTLSVRDVVLIDRLDLSFGEGLTVLTGETGAGKSILLDSLGLALGRTGNAGLVREGCAQASVTAAFTVAADHPSHALLAESELPVDDGELVLRRTLARDGRSRAFVNDQPVGLALLRRLGATLVEIQGQHEQMGLADAAAHRRLLDAFGVPAELLAGVRTAHAAWRELAARLATARAALGAAAREEDWLRAATDELAALAPEPDEEGRLAAARVALQGGERRREAIAAALSELAPRDRRNAGPAAALRAAARALSKAALPEAGPGAGRQLADDAAAALDRAEEALAEAETLMSRLAAEAEDDPHALEEAETRLFALRAAARKHNVPATELAALLAELRARLEALEGGQKGIEALVAETAAARTAFEAAAGALARRRREASAALEVAVAAELTPLKLGRARFVVSVEALAAENWGENGADAVTFLLAANPGSTPAPLGRVASGGELSRLMLGLKVVLAAGAPAGTLVFDEVDQGIGGATASAVGERLAVLARIRQVMVVTHAPQVAARADHHLNVAKHVRGETTITAIAPLDKAARREEIARMLAGERVTDAARAAASDLLL